MLASVGIPLAVGELMNRVHLPRVRNTDILFASGVTNTIFEEGHRISGYSLIELNRLIEDGCNFTVETIEAPASIHELLRDVDLRLPVIGMDGAILFDMKERTYLEAVMMDPDITAKIRALLEAADIEFFITTLEHHVLIYRYGELKNDAIREVFKKKRVSPDRNFAPRLTDVSYMNKTIYFFILEKAEKVDSAVTKIRNAPWADRIRINVDERNIPEGYRGRYDVYIEDANKDLMVKELKRRFEPVSLKGWKNILRLDRSP